MPSSSIVYSHTCNALTDITHTCEHTERHLTRAIPHVWITALYTPIPMPCVSGMHQDTEFAVSLHSKFIRSDETKDAVFGLTFRRCSFVLAFYSFKNCEPTLIPPLLLPGSRKGFLYLLDSYSYAMFSWPAKLCCCQQRIATAPSVGAQSSIDRSSLGNSESSDVASSTKRHVVVAIDGSQVSKAATEWALRVRPNDRILCRV